MTDEKLKCVRNIRALTTAIYVFQPPKCLTDNPLASRSGKHNGLSKAYNHLALLLSKGENEIAITGSIDGRPDLKAVVQEQQHKPRTIMISEADELLPPLEKIVVTQNSVKDSTSDPSVRRILPSETSLEDLADPVKNPYDSEHTPEAHASDLFQALIQSSTHRADFTMMQLMQFIWLRCHKKILYRLDAPRKLLGKPLPQILREWEPVEEDLIEEQWFTVKPLLDELLLNRIPSREYHGQRQYLFSHSTASAWAQTFCHVLESIEKHFKISPTRHSIGALVFSFTYLDSLLYSAAGCIEALFSVQSLGNVLANAMKAQDDKRTLKAWSDSEATVPNEAFFIDEEALSSGDNPQDDAGKVIFICCRSMVAWIRAALSLSRLEIFRMDPLPRFHLIQPYRPADIKQMTKIEELMEKTIRPRLSVSDKEFLPVTRYIQKNKTWFQHFPGQIHSEAFLMALIFASGSRNADLPFDPLLNLQLKSLFSDSDCVIGVAKKSCFCCYKLAGLLSADDPTHAEFIIPGTNGIIFPWTPPELGIPLEILSNLEKQLEGALVDAVTNFIEHHRPFRSSAASSPASSIGVPFDDSTLDNWKNTYGDASMVLHR